MQCVRPVYILALLCAIGCQDPRGPVSLNSDDPDLKIIAIRNCAADNDQRDIPKLVENLNSDDPAIRFYSIEALHRLTHDDFGYHYYEEEDQRAPALLRWQAWLQSRSKQQK
jgi:hypothetical protein